MNFFDDFTSGGASGPAGLVSRAGAVLVSLGSRLLVHFCSLIVAAIITSTLSVPDAGFAAKGALVFSAYVGLICLLPRGMGPTVDWLIPTGLGFFLIPVWAVSGLPWQFAALWGGALTWTIRLLARRGQMDWEWAVLPALLIALFCFFDVLLPLSRVNPPYLTFPLLAAGGWGALLLYARLKGDSVQLAMLKQACAAMESLVDGKKLPPEIIRQVKDLASKGRMLLTRKPRLDASTKDIVNAMHTASGQLSRMGVSVSPMVLAKMQASLGHLATILNEMLMALEPPKPETPQSAEERALSARLESFGMLIRQLADKRYTLPPELQAHVDGIALAADEIINCMRNDPQDVAPGDRFLSRYLKAAHTVIDDYSRLSVQGGKYAGVAEALAKASDLLARLKKAFEEEHAALLRNDTMDFTAELNVLDKLLKMDGK